MDVLSNYREVITPSIISFINNEIDKVGVISFLDTCIPHLDCTRTDKQGIRIIQTVSYRYDRLMAEIIYVIDNYYDGDKNEYYAKVLDIHNKNIEYEKLNPPVLYDTKSKKSTASKSKAKSNTEPKEKKITAAERKLADKALKLSKLTFNIGKANAKD